MSAFDPNTVTVTSTYPHLDMSLRKVVVNKQLVADGSMADVEMQYNLQGPENGPVVVWIMGLGGQSVNYPYETLIRPLLHSGYRVLRIDNRDSGLSTHFCGRLSTPSPVSRRVIQMTNSSMNWVMSGFGLFNSPLWSDIAEPTADYSLDTMAEDVKNLLDILHIDKVHIAGVSMGGMLSQTFALNYPDRVISLTSVMSSANDKAYYLQASLTFLLSMFVGRTPPKYPSIFTRRAVAASMLEWAEYLTGGNTLMGAGPTATHDGGHHYFEKILLGVRRAMNLNSPNKDGVLRQMAAIESAPARTDRLRAQAAKMRSLIVHGDKDLLVPTANAAHVFTTMANGIRKSKEGSTTPEEDLVPRDEFRLALLSSADGKYKYTEDVAEDGNYVRLQVIKDGSHDMNDAYVLTMLPVYLDHLRDADRACGIETGYCLVNNPWKIPEEMDCAEPGSKIPGLGSCVDVQMRLTCEQLIQKLVEERKYDGDYFPKFDPVELPRRIARARHELTNGADSPFIGNAANAELEQTSEMPVPSH